MENDTLRLRITLHGAVQGTGFRPFIYRLATELKLHGWVCNTAFGLITEVEGPVAQLETFLQRLEIEKPTHAMVSGTELEELPPVGFSRFEIQASQEGEKTAFILPDLAICRDCRQEILTPGNRRYRYPFTNCTHCGPRYTILEDLPYDRANTTMRSFKLCPDCQAEYNDPRDRRFHAQPIACPACGPGLAFWNEKGEVVARLEDALQEAVRQLRSGAIVALKGIGGFQLMVDACNPEAVNRLRRRKRREEKPFAVMYPHLSQARHHCRIDAAEERILEGSAAPILLLPRISTELRCFCPAAAVAPGNPYLGVMLPYSPLHLLLLEEIAAPLVATSGNISEEPMCIDEQEALQRLAGIADFFLVHNRPIARPVDDSVARILLGKLQILRRARGYSPLPILIAENAPILLSVGGHLKNTVALSRGPQVFLSQHVGDLETAAAYDSFRKSIDTLCRIYQLHPQAIYCDAHPDYLSTRYAVETGLPVSMVQHHAAHALSCIAEHGLAPPVLAVVWDGTGYGADGTVWGGEWFSYGPGHIRRIAHLRSFRLPGSTKAVREPYRAAFGLLWEWYEGKSYALDKLSWAMQFAEKERNILYAMLRSGHQSPRTTSIGRLFDAVAALLYIQQVNRFEGQAAMGREFQAQTLSTEDSYSITWKSSLPGIDNQPNSVEWIADWGPLVEELLRDIHADQSVALMAAKFHNALADCIAALVRKMGIRQVVLSGGCFQNRLLMEKVASLLSAEWELYWPQKVPPNDGGIALGQIYAGIKAITGDATLISAASRVQN